MTLELILWILAGIVVSEIIFFIWYRHICTKVYNEWDTFKKGDWLSIKVISILIACGITFIHAMVVFNDVWVELVGAVPHYEYLLYEIIIIIFIGLLFLLNKLIANKIEEKS